MNFFGAMIAFFLVILLVITKGLIHSKSLKAERRIPIDDIELIDLHIDYPHAFAPRLTGKIRNKSTQITLKTILLRISIYNDVEMKKITLTTHQYFNVNIRPGKSDYINEFIRIKGNMGFMINNRCLCEVVEAKGT